MKSRLFSIALLSTVGAFGAAMAADTNTYQVTGPVLAVTPTAVTIQKDKEKWEIARDASTQIKGDLKVGAKATVKYRMTAASVEVKDEKKK